MAKAKGKDVNDLTVVLLDRPRNEPYIQAARAAGARIRLIRDGDVAASIATARADTSIDLLLGIGGSPEACHLGGRPQMHGRGNPMPTVATRTEARPPPPGMPGSTSTR